MSPGGPSSPRSRRTWILAAAAVALPVLVAAGLAAAVALSHAQVTPNATSLATVDLPFGGGTITRIDAVRARDAREVPVSLRGRDIWPAKLVPAGERLTVYATVKRPGWIAWLTGATEHVQMTLTAPTAVLRSQYLTVRSGQPLRIAYEQPVRVFAAGPSGGALHRHALSAPTDEVSLPASGPAGTIAVAAAPRTWERPRTMSLSWFPPGAKATAVASPAPGSKIGPRTRLTLTFSKPVAQALGSHLPPVSPDTPGTWHAIGTHAITFVPTGYGYGLGANVSIALPSGIHLMGGVVQGSDPQGHWTVPAGSTLRLQQLLAQLGYLPVSFEPSGKAVPMTLTAQENAAIHPPAGSFTWRYANTPSALRGMWQPGTAGELTKGAVMAFENDQGMTADGVAGAQVWKALLAATLHDQANSSGYTFVSVSEGSPESETTWHDGKTVASGAVNTGVASMPTATGTFAVFEHLRVTTMTGTNPDGSHYVDPGIPWVSYFNGGDALHGFIRASYGFPQSDGCVEMPYSEAAQVWPYTPIGTIVNVTG